MKYQSVYELNRVQQYIMQMRPILRKQATIFRWNKGSQDACRTKRERDRNDPFSGRTKDNVDVVWLCPKDTRYQMKLVERDDTFDYYAVRIPLTTERFSYYFEVRVRIAKLLLYAHLLWCDKRGQGTVFL